jgi:hypothetical protein
MKKSLFVLAALVFSFTGFSQAGGVGGNGLSGDSAGIKGGLVEGGSGERGGFAKGDQGLVVYSGGEKGNGLISPTGGCGSHGLYGDKGGNGIVGRKEGGNLHHK